MYTVLTAHCFFWFVTEWGRAKLFVRPMNRFVNTFSGICVKRNSLISPIAGFSQACAPSPPHTADQKVPGENMRFDMPDIPKDLAPYSARNTSLSAQIPPGQEMANWIRKEISIVAPDGLPFLPYLTPKMAGYTWAPADTDRKTARGEWSGLDSHARRSLIQKELSIRAFSLYRLRFRFAADICKDRLRFGGLAPQISRLSAVLRLSATETVGEALFYHMLANTNLWGKARKRSVVAADCVSILATEELTLKEQSKKKAVMDIVADRKVMKRRAYPRETGNWRAI